MKITLSIIIGILTINTLYAGPRRPSMADSYNRAIMADSSVNTYNANMAAAKAIGDKNWQKENPWFVDTQWRSLTNKIDIAQKQRMVKSREYNLLVGVGQKDTPRGNQLSLFMSNSVITIYKWNKEKDSIEQTYKLKQFYQTNRVQ